MTDTSKRADLGTLRLAVPGGMAVQEFRWALNVVEEVYNGLTAVDSLIRSATERRERFGEQPFLLADVPPVLLSPSFNSSTLVPASDRLIFGSAEISSPGWVEVIGQLNPLTQIREYLKDRHERKKDKDYRNEAERRRLQLENELLADRVINERVDLLHELGVSEHQIVLMLNELVVKPIGELNRAQDAEILALTPSEDAA